MVTRVSVRQIALRDRAADTSTGVTREAAKPLLDVLGVDETQAMHLAPRERDTNLLAQYEADDGPSTVSQVRQIKKLASQGKKRSVRSSLFRKALV